MAIPKLIDGDKKVMGGDPLLMIWIASTLEHQVGFACNWLWMTSHPIIIWRATSVAWS